MKGTRLHILIFTLIALGFGILMAVLNLYPSWSQYARSAQTSLLYLVLLSIFVTFWDRSKTHPKRDERAYRLLGMRISRGRADRITAIMFAGVICTPVNVELLEIPHLIFTGLGILSAFLGMVTYSKWYVPSVIAGAFLFLASFIPDTYSVAWGEVFAALPIGHYILKTNNYGS